MKKTTFLGCLLVLLSFKATHAFETLKLQNVQMNLSSETGEGQLFADDLKFLTGPLRVESHQPQLNFSWKEGTFETQIDHLQMAYTFGRDSFLAGLKGVTTQSFYVDYQEGKRLSVENNGLLIEHSDTKQFIPKLNLTCAANAQKSLIDDISNQCLHLGRLRVPVLNFDELSGARVAQSLSEEEVGIQKILDKVEEIDLMILQKAFNLTFRVRLLFKWKVKASGNVNYDEANGLLDIHLDKAKVGILSLKKKVLKELAEANLESIKVVGDHIYIQI